MTQDHESPSSGLSGFAGRETARRVEKSLPAVTEAVRAAIKDGVSSETVLAAYRKGLGKEETTPNLPENVACAVSAALAEGHTHEDVLLVGIRPGLETLLSQTPQQPEGNTRAGWMEGKKERSPHSADPKNSHGWGGRG